MADATEVSELNLEAVAAEQRLDAVLLHIDRVRDNCRLLGKRLMRLGRISDGLRLVQAGQLHDCSKLAGIEWEHLQSETSSAEFKMALEQHRLTNSHHPEYWGDISAMPDAALAEMVCDWAARAAEQGSNLRDWIATNATKKYKLKLGGKVFKRIKEYVDLLLEPPFKAKDS